ncbi:hypothetical protein BAE44_0022433 [Dichanthelium oligosanthes]|uniref:Uncharacterized protein n=1 Tax=Dichanthelium oligosanthes TaxID=888268 RepID=A0A1E5UUI7_9POAL|nr:hypothetical protein BAE44_0022433 [Dichanthelium oligosanthes]
MAGGSKCKVREWMRKRMAPRRKAAAGSGDSGSSDQLSAPTPPASTPSSPERKLLASGIPSALRWRKPRGNALASLFQRAAYHLLWLVESVVVVAQLIFFFVRFGFRL